MQSIRPHTWVGAFAIYAYESPDKAGLFFISRTLFQKQQKAFCTKKEFFRAKRVDFMKIVMQNIQIVLNLTKSLDFFEMLLYNI